MEETQYETFSWGIFQGTQSPVFSLLLMPAILPWSWCDSGNKPAETQKG